MGNSRAKPDSEPILLLVREVRNAVGKSLNTIYPIPLRKCIQILYDRIKVACLLAVYDSIHKRLYTLDLITKFLEAINNDTILSLA